MRRPFLCAALFCTLIAATGCSAAASSDDDGLGASEGELAGLAQTDVVSTIHYGESAHVASSATRRYRAVQFAGAKGDAIDFWVRSSADARAWLIAPDFKKTVASNDDDSPSTKDAHVTATLPAAGTYTIVFREKHSVTTTFDVALTGSAPVGPGPQPSSSLDACVKHPWAMAYGCRDHQGRSTAVGPTKPVLAWEADLPQKTRVDILLADANGTAYAIQGSVINAITPSGQVAWHTGAFGRVSDVALGSDDALYVYEQSASSAAYKHTLARFSTADGKRTQIFTEGLGSTYLPRQVLPLPDGRVFFGVPSELAKTAANEQVTPSAKIYDPKTQSLVDATPRPSFFRGADLPGGEFFTSEYDLVMKNGNPTNIYWLDRHASSGAVITHTDGAQLWGVAPGGTVYGVKTNPLDGSEGWPSIVRPDGTLQVLTQSKAGTIPFTFAITSDDALVYGGRGATPTSNPPHVIGKYTKSGTKVFETQVRVDGGNVAVDANGNIYAGGQGFAPNGATLFTSWSLGYWLPENGLVALGGNRTLYSTYTLSTSSGRVAALRDATP